MSIRPRPVLPALLAALVIVGCGSDSINSTNNVDYLTFSGSRSYEIQNANGLGFNGATLNVMVTDLQPVTRAASLNQVLIVFNSSDGRFDNTPMTIQTGSLNTFNGQISTTDGTVYAITVQVRDTSPQITVVLRSVDGELILEGSQVNASDNSGGGDPTSNARLSLSTTSLPFAAGETVKTFTITNAGTGTITWTVTDDQPFVTVAPASGEGEGEVTVTIDRTGLAAGTHPATVTVQSNGGTLQVAVAVTVE